MPVQRWVGVFLRINQADIPSEITVRAGQQLKISVPYSGGHPPPTARWTNDDVPIDEKRAVIEVSSPTRVANILYPNRCTLGWRTCA